MRKGCHCRERKYESKRKKTHCPGEEKHVNPVHCLEPWVPGDFDLTTGQFKKGILSSKKQAMYDSSLALGTNMFAAPGVYPDSNNPYQSKYYLRNFNIDFDKPNPLVPGPFDYDKSWSLWGGDNTYQVGKLNYSGIIDHFGHTHIMTVYSKIAVKVVDPDAKTRSQDLMLEHLIGSSTQIFKWFAQLVDINGNPIPYDPNTASGSLKAFMDMLITGKGTPNDSGVIDTDVLIQTFQTLKDSYAPNSQELQTIIDMMTEFLKYILVDHKIDLLAWKPLMTTHQEHAYEMYIAYRDLYQAVYRNRCNVAFLTKEAQRMFQDLIETGHQLAAFFGVFYSAVVFLDTFLDVLGDLTPPAIPPQDRTVRLRLILDNNIRYWREHVSFFDDFGKYNALSKFCNFSEKLFQIQVTQLESCSNLGSSVGEIFSSFDAVVRNRHLFEKI
jgi:hypothetical protein